MRRRLWVCARGRVGRGWGGGAASVRAARGCVIGCGPRERHAAAARKVVEDEEPDEGAGERGRRR